MKPTSVTLRTPLIHFLGKRTVPGKFKYMLQHENLYFNLYITNPTRTLNIVNIDHTPRPHPMSPTGKLPPSFSSFTPSAGIAASSGSTATALKYTPPAPGEYAAIKDLPARFRFKTLSDAEIENINEGGASVLF